ARIRIAVLGRTPLARYHEDWHRCSFCEHNNKFAEGYVLLCSDGPLRLIGDCCHKLHFEMGTFEAARDAWRSSRRRAAFESIRAALPAAFEALLAQLRVLGSGTGKVGLRDLEVTGKRLRDCLAALGPEFDRALRRGGEL